MKKILDYVILLVMFSASCWSMSDDGVSVDVISEHKWQLLWQEISHKEGRFLSDEGPTYRIELPKEMSIYFFTKQDHPAHPSIVRRTVVKTEKGIEIKTKAWVAGSKEHFENWLSGFVTQDLKMKNTLSSPE